MNDAGPQRRATIRPAELSDLDPVLELLRAAALPAAGVSESLSHFLVAEDGGRMVGVAGLELYGSSAILRSVAVVPAWRGSGLARQLIDRLLTTAQDRGIDDIYLLTTTAEHYFPRYGFACIARDDVPAAVRESIEFREACPASAVVMRKSLVGTEV
jgi:amino-acid N-acetyltransferase